ncbi:hypothetical protein [Streptomyces sp. HPF1205]|uniref:hypothetical protein n=1 Tax=Streptomyces sp. HPF1205 TaxID=2873262 RepID=UPI001CEDF4CC|nr:hypothetical protein [Streptomyces sp. HPF1205]
MKRTIVTAAAALMALAALQGRGQALSDDAGAPAARRPAVWQPSGEPLAGHFALTGAPRMRAAVTYRDTIRPGETRYYGIKLDGTSSAYASAFAVPPPGARVTYGDGIEVELIGADGTLCDRDDAALDDQGAPRPVGTAVSRTAGADSPCDGAGQYHLRVRRTSGSGGSDTTAWPLELRYVVEPPLRPGATPEPAPYLGSASPTPLTTGTVGHAQGGPSPETAAPVRTGIWQDQVLPGETRFYKVPVDWGQQATVFADFGGAQAAGGASSSLVGSGVRLRAYSPVRKFITGAGHSYDGRLVRIGTQLAPVSYTNRTTSDAQVSAVRYAGWYYFAVSVHPKVAQVVGGGRPVALTLRVDVKGTALPGPPYAGDPAKAGIGVSAHDVTGADGTPPTSSASAAAPSSSSSGTPGLRLLAFGAFGTGTVLLAGLAGWTVLARRRDRGRRAMDPGPSHG